MKKTHPIVVLLWNTIIVAAVFMLVDFVWYGWLSPGPIPYSQVFMGNLGITFILSAAFAHIYDKAANIWAVDSKKTFVFTNTGAEGSGKSLALRLLNGVIFSLLLWVIIMCAMALMDVIMSTIYVHLLDGIRGAAPTGDEHEDAELALQLALAAATLEATGRTEDKPRY